MTSQEMMKQTCKPGYWFVNVAPLDANPDWIQEVVPYESYYLFGYLPTELIAKQYK